MDSIQSILRDHEHRPFPLPDAPWKFYQEWHDVIFAHWKVPVKQLRPLIPDGLDIDLFEGEAWVSLVAFQLKNLRLHYFPPFPELSDFIEINMRTYVLRKGKPGIYFFCLEAQKEASALMAKFITRLPYVKSDIKGGLNSYESKNLLRDFHMRVNYTVGEGFAEKKALDSWLLERYCLFHELRDNIYSHDIHHRAWVIRPVQINAFNLNYRFKDLVINNKAQLYHYSKGVQVPTWGKRRA
jgi:uncharacterized protein